jgi:GTPase SAR1 family protein
MKIKQTGEFNLAYRFVTETNQNIFLTGKAGTGKTTFLKYLRENSLKKSIVTAPTGVAAINAQGVTLHSLFQLPFGIIIPDQNQLLKGKTNNHPLLSKIRYNNDKSALLRNLELLIIDEASMVASYTVDAVDTILRYVRRNPYSPFGGVQVLLIGDLFQLPPVVKNEEREILQEYYNSVFFFDSYVLRDNVPVIIELKEIFRQKDEKFIEILNGIRNNDISDENFKMLNSRISGNITVKNNEEYITLTTHNFQSNEINQQKLKSLAGYTHTFFAEIIDEFPENSYPAEEELKLKTGAQVMFLKNDTEGRRYFNGKIGIITGLGEDIIKVKCKDDYDEIEVRKSEWQNIKYRINPDTHEITEEVLGSFIQYPLRLAWAITIHKSQGLTFDKMIIDAEKAFAKGQVYVALSRCTSLEGLILKTPVYRNFLGAYKEFEKWQNNNLDKNLSGLLIESRQNFILEELLNIFALKNWEYKLKELKYFIEDNSEKINTESFTWVNELILKQNELSEVSEKFRQTIIGLNNKNPLIEENEILQKRIKDGANYFYTAISAWYGLFLNHPLAFETKRLSGKTDDILSDISKMLNEILLKINFCKSGFNFDNYQKERKHFINKPVTIKSSFGKIRSSYLKKQNTVKITVSMFRDTKSIIKVAEERNLTVGTIENHLSKGILKKIIHIEEIIPVDEVKEIAKYFPSDLEEVRLNAIKEKVPPEITYGKLRMVLAWLKKND